MLWLLSLVGLNALGPRNMRLIPAVVCFVLGASALMHARVWTDREGRTFEGEMLDQTREHILVRRAVDGREGWLAIRILSDADQAYVRSQADPEGDATAEADADTAAAETTETATEQEEDEKASRVGAVEVTETSDDEPDETPAASADATPPADARSETIAAPAPEEKPRRVLVQERPAPDPATPDGPEPVNGFWSTDLEATLARLDEGTGLMVLYRHRADPEEFRRFLEQVMADHDVYKAFKGQFPLVVLEAKSQLLEDHLDARLLEKNDGPFLFGLAPGIGDEPVMVRWPMKSVTEAHQRDALRGKQAFLDRLEPVFLRLNLGIERALAQAARNAPPESATTADDAATRSPEAGTPKATAASPKDNVPAAAEDAPDPDSTETASDAQTTPASDEPAG